MTVLTAEAQIATDELLMSLADHAIDPINARKMLEWALNSGQVEELKGWTGWRLDLAIEEAAEVLSLLGSERNNARYRGAMLRLGIALKHPYTGR